MGKTSLARALPKLLDEEARVAVILRPSTSWNAIRSSIAKQWKLGEGGLARSNLLSFARENRLVLVIDQAESASTDILDHLDVLLSYRTEDDEPVVQSVLFANLSAYANNDPPPLIWWLDRIQTLELQFAPLPRDGVGSYIHKHLKRAGWKGGSLFSFDAAHAIHGYTGGTPGEVDRVCELLLNEAAERNLRAIDAAFVHELLDDQAEEDSSTYDTFEELVMEDEFIGAEENAQHKPESAPSLQETLGRFSEPETAFAVENDADPDTSSVDGAERSLDGTSEDTLDGRAEPKSSIDTDQNEEPEIPTLNLVDLATAESQHGEDDCDAHRPAGHDGAAAENEIGESSLTELEAYLSQPPSEEELRAVIGSRLWSAARTAFVVAFAVTLGGVMISWMSGGSEDPVKEKRAIPAIDETRQPNPTIFANPDGLSIAIPEKPVLARLRGPVSQSDAPPPSAAIEPDGSPAVTPPGLGNGPPEQSPAAPAALGNAKLDEASR
jgi:type II secretory pathway predicted ATPase ExeA